MKKIISLLLLISLLFSFGCLGYTQFSQKIENKESNAKALENLTNVNLQENISFAQTSKDINSKMVVYYFHVTNRCNTCLTIEEYSREAIEQYFFKELKDEALEVRSINIEEPENTHYIREYSLYTSSLVIVVYKNGKLEKWKNLEKIWDYVKNKEIFYQYIKSEIESFIIDGK